MKGYRLNIHLNNRMIISETTNKHNQAKKRLKQKLITFHKKIKTSLI